MPTYRDDLHMGHKTPLVETDDINNGAITKKKIEDNAIDGSKIAEEAIEGRHIQPSAVDTQHIKDGAVTPDKLAPGFASKVVLPLVGKAAKDLQNQIDSLEVAGVAVSNEFGDNEHISISQKTLTEALNTVYHLLEEALGRILLGFTWSITPTYIYGEWPTTVHITAQPASNEDSFDYIKLTVNGEVVDEIEEKTAIYTFDIDLQQSATIRLDAKILGTPYYRTEDVHHYTSFWLGSGSDYAAIMDEAHAINFNKGSRVSKDVTVADGEHIILVIGDTWVPAFLRADIGGVEIPFTSEDVTIDGHTYRVYTSENTYNEGTYNIDING